MYAWRITKYDPRYRDESGVFLHDDWTSFSDIGKVLPGRQPIMSKDYLRVEDAYIAAVKAFMQELGMATLQVKHLEKREDTYELRRMEQERQQYRELFREDMFVLWEGLEDGQSVGLEEIDMLCRLVLREYAWCKLESEQGMFVHFGWDYYMYIGAVVACERALVLVKSIGLFAEPLPASPYSDDTKGEKS